MSYFDFIKQYTDISKHVPNYRLGQHFINTFIKKEDNTTDYNKLWNETDLFKANKSILGIIDKLQWDINNLPVNN